MSSYRILHSLLSALMVTREGTSQFLTSVLLSLHKAFIPSSSISSCITASDSSHPARIGLLLLWVPVKVCMYLCYIKERYIVLWYFIRKGYSLIKETFPGEIIFELSKKEWVGVFTKEKRRDDYILGRGYSTYKGTVVKRTWHPQGLREDQCRCSTEREDKLQKEMGTSRPSCCAY